MKHGNTHNGKSNGEICSYRLEEGKGASVALRGRSLLYKRFFHALISLFALVGGPLHADSTDLGLIDLAPGETVSFTKVVSRHWYYASSRSSSYDCIYAQIKVPVGTPIICRLQPNLSPETINSIGSAWSYTNEYNQVKFALYTAPTYTSAFKLYENTYSLQQAERIYVPATADYPYGRTYYAVIHHYRYSTNVASQNTYYDISFTWPIAPAQPSSITAQKSGAGIQISWGASQLATSYRLYKYCNGAFVTKWDRTDNSFYDSDVSSGNTYQYYVDARNEYGTSEMLGSSVLIYGQDSTTAPSNDNFSSPITISGTSGSKTGSNVGATLESSELKPCAQSSSTGSVWYKWTAQASGTVTIDTIGSGFDTVLGVYTGSSVLALTEIASNDDIENGNTKSRVTFTANSGTIYRIAVYGYNGANGSFTLNWSLTSGGGVSSGATKYALCVGLNSYDMTSWRNQGFSLSVLKGCVNDANYFRDNLINRGGWSSANVTRLTDSGATKNAIRAAIQSYAANAKSGDTFIYQHSSHALNHKDTSGNYTKDVALAAYAGPYEDYELASDLAGFTSGVKVVIIIDACHSSGLFKSPQDSQPFGLAERVSALVDKLRAEKIAKGEKDYVSKIAASEIGWVTAAEYNETSADGGFYDSDDWLTDWSYIGNVWAGAFMGAFTWGWWNGLADTTGVGDNDGLMDAYEGYKYAHSIVTSLGLSTPQYLNVSILRNIELGTSGGSETPADPVSPPGAPSLTGITTYGSAARTDYIEVKWSAAARAASYNVYRNTSSSTSGREKIATNVASPYRDYVSNGLTPGVKYWYWVESVNSAGSAFSGSDWGNISVSASLSKTTLGFTAAGGTSNITVTANTSWSATNSDSWLSLSSSGTSGNGSIAVTAAPNTTATVRTGRIIVTAGAGTSYSKTVTNTVTQSANASAGTYAIKFNRMDYSGTTLTYTFDVGIAQPLPRLWADMGWSYSQHEFLGWDTNNYSSVQGQIGEVVYADGASVKDLAASGETAFLYAVWTTTSTANDDFASATRISGNSGSIRGSTVGATSQSGEPLISYLPSATNTIWWAWTAPESGTATFSTTNTAFDTVMGVYTGTQVSGLTVIKQDDDGGPNRTSICTFSATQGVTYYIAVSGYGNSNQGAVRLDWRLEITRLPDICPYAPAGWSGSLVLSASSQNATSSTTTSFSPNDVIYVSHAVVNLGAGFSNDFKWALYVDEALRTTGANWGSGLSSNGISRWTALPIGPLSPGTHIIKVVYDYTGLVTEADEGNNAVTRTITVSGAVVCPINDNYANATAISGISGSVTGSNVNATYESGEPLRNISAGATNTIWWTWTAPATGIAQFSTAGSEVSYTAMGVYVGNSVSALTTVSASSDSYSQSSISFSVVSGTRYYIAVSGTGYRYQGNIKLNWSMFTPVSLNTALDNAQLTFTTGGAANWVGVSDESYSGGSSARSGAISHSQSSWMQTEVSGEGVLSFWYKVSSESYCDKLTFYIDGVQKATASGTAGWTRFECTVSNNTQHVFKWTYSKDGSVSSGNDCCWIDKVNFSAVEARATTTTPDPVPYSWIETEAATILAAHGGNYEAAANATARNGLNKVWECYVAGIDPEDETAKFEATIEMVDGRPVVRWNPPLSPEEEEKRTRKVLGKRTLDPAEEWTDVTDVPDPDAAGYRFFKTAVEMK